MGISGFLQLTKSVQQPMHIKEYAGKTVAVDGNVWLHRGAFACAYELATHQNTTKYIDYVLRLVDMLLFFKVIPIIVFDGNPLPIKKHTNDERHSHRTEARRKGQELLHMGKKQEATEHFQKAIEVTSDMIQQVIKALDKKRVKSIVAPYEADAQLTYLITSKKVDAVITEDSDLLVFGCDTVILKMNAYGEAVQVRRRDLSLSKEIDFSDWDTEKIRHMCILAGCDYLPSLPGIGLKNAHKLLRKHKSIDLVLRQLSSQGKMKSAPNYERDFLRANNTFLYQYVFDPDQNTFIHLNTPPTKVVMDYLGTCPTVPQKETKDNKAAPTKVIPRSRSVNTGSYLALVDDNKENIPPWLRDLCDTKSSPSRSKPASARRDKHFSLPLSGSNSSPVFRKRSFSDHSLASSSPKPFALSTHNNNNINNSNSNAHPVSKKTLTSLTTNTNTSTSTSDTTSSDKPAKEDFNPKRRKSSSFSSLLGTHCISKPFTSVSN